MSEPKPPARLIDADSDATLGTTIRRSMPW